MIDNRKSLLFWGGPKHLQRIKCRGGIVRFMNPDGSKSEYMRCRFHRSKKIIGEELMLVERAYVMIVGEPRSIADYDEIAKQMDIHLTHDDWEHIGFAEKEETT